MISLFAHLTRLEIPFLLIGGRGLEAHGYVRNTHDLDLLVRLTDLNELTRSIREFGYALAVETAIFSRWRAADPAIDDLDLIYVDPGTFDKLNRDAVTITYGELSIRVPSITGMIALKLHAMRNQPGRTIRDTQDIQAVLHLHPQAVALDDLRVLCEKYGPPGIFDEIHRKTS
ncbi:MAG: hypothetical protein NWT04_14845 [Verrucomicrobiales bacterium]|nr:hypothetical protein [Verrucomicrobiales bacterium]